MNIYDGEKYFYSPSEKYYDALNVWFCFPAEYSIGMSALGYLNLYKILDQKQTVFPQRVFTDLNKNYLGANKPDLISFSFSFEFDFINIFNFLRKNNIEFLAQKRDADAPLIMGGGVVLTANPEPFCDIFDFILIGDGEELIAEVTNVLYENKSLSKAEKLDKLRKLNGCYVPSMQNFKDVNRRIYKNSDCIYSPIVTENTTFSDMFLVEVTRGCPYKCNFCLTSHINNPVNYASYESMTQAIDIGINNCQNIGLLGALVPANPNFEQLCEYLIEKRKYNDFKVSIGSLRADFITKLNIQMLTACGQKTTTIAVEAGSQRLRDFINKKLTEEQIINAVSTCYENGLEGIKIYAIIGLPTETSDDIEDLIFLIKKIKQKKKLTLSINSFVPKKFTPFENEKMENIKSLEKKLSYITKECHKTGIGVRTSSLAWNEIQGVISLGDRNLLEKLLLAYNDGSTIGAFRKYFRNN